MMLRMRHHRTFQTVFEAALAAQPEFIHHSLRRMFRSSKLIEAALRKAPEAETGAETVT
jgi:hypothetical protein